MNLKKNHALLTILFFVLFASTQVFGSRQDNELVKAIQLFDEKKYLESEQILKKLLEANPDHLMVNYFYGACRTENGHYGNNEIIYLLNGSSGEAPLETDYYLAIQYHAKNRWDEALKHYTRYKGNINEEEQKKVHLSEKIQQCYDKVNPYITEDDTINPDILPVAVARKNELEAFHPVLKVDSVSVSDSFENDGIDSANVAMAVSPEAPVFAEPEFEPINFIINGEITYIDSTNFQTKKGLESYIEGTKKEVEFEQQTKALDALRKQYGACTSYEEKQKIGTQILSGETNNFKLQNEYQNLLQKAKQAEINYWSNATSDEKDAFLAKIEEEIKAHQKTQTIEEVALDSALIIRPGAFLSAPTQKKAIENENNDELIYKIQIGAYSRGVPSYRKKQYEKLSYIRKIENYTDEKGVVVYTTGNLNNYDDALKMQNQVRQEGIEHAFIVPYSNGKRITLKKAKEIEVKK